jgi:hypothetical protein
MLKNSLSSVANSLIYIGSGRLCRRHLDAIASASVNQDSHTGYYGSLRPGCLSQIPIADPAFADELLKSFEFLVWGADQRS